MAREEKKIMRRRLIGAYVSSVVSISLVLLLVGAASLVVVNAKSVADYFKESLQMSVLLNQDVTEEDAASFAQTLSAEPFVHSARLVTRAEGTAELEKMLGEDFLSVFETSPVPLSIDVSLKADYVSRDSLDVVKPLIEAAGPVDEVVCQQNLLDALNSNLTKISLILSVFILLLLFISVVLISNTVRINVFSQRFNIHTMKLVGATRGFIRGPFMVRSIWQGLSAAALASVILAGGILVLRNSFSELFSIFRPELLCLVFGIIVVSGILICLVSTYFVVNKLVSLDKDELYG